MTMIYRFEVINGGLAEWPIAPVFKTGEWC